MELVLLSNKLRGSRRGSLRRRRRRRCPGRRRRPRRRRRLRHIRLVPLVRGAGMTVSETVQTFARDRRHVVLFLFDVVVFIFYAAVTNVGDTCASTTRLVNTAKILISVSTGKDAPQTRNTARLMMSLRDLTMRNRDLPRPYTIGDRAFPVAGARVRNALPSFVTDSATVATFKCHLKTYLFARSLS